MNVFSLGAPHLRYMGGLYSKQFSCLQHLMSGSGKGVLGVVGISWNEVGAGTFPDKVLDKP